MRFIFSPLLIALGILIMKYCVAITNGFTGPIDFAEKYLRFFGGTYGFWRLFGLGLVIFGMMWLTGLVAVNQNSQLQIQLLYELIR